MLKGCIHDNDKSQKTCKSKSLSLAVVSAYMGKSPNDVRLPFIFDEVYELAKRGLNVHAIRAKVEKKSYLYGIKFHGVSTIVSIETIKSTLASIIENILKHSMRDPIRIYWENLYTHEIIKIVKEYNIDIIHAHFLYPEGLCSLFAKRRTHSPLIVTTHGYELNVVPEIGYGLLLRREYLPLVKTVLKEADLVIAVSKELYKKAKTLDSKSNVVYLPNAVNTKVFCPPKSLEEKLEIRRNLLNLHENHFVLINTRHLTPVYDHSTIIASLAYLKRINPTLYRRTRLIIIGDGPLRKYIRLLAYKLNVIKNVIIVGYKPRNLISKFLKAADVFVNTSLSEGMPLSILEAMATGLPVISTPVGGIPDIIKDKENGFLVSPKNYKELALALQKLFEGNMSIKMGIFNRHKVMNNFSIGKRINKLIKLYEEVLN